jgi:hypothetical protein
MLPYIDLHTESLVLLFGYGLLGFFSLVLAHSARDIVVGKPREVKTPEGPDDGKVKEGHGRVPVFLVVLYVCLAIWAVLYVLAHGMWGMDFGG